MKRLLLLIVLFAGTIPALRAQQKIEIHQIDVGTGDAALINVMNNGGGIQYSILIDAGETDQEETVIEYLQAHAKQAGGKVYLDYVLTSHYHSDHIGGLVGIQTATYASGTVGKKRKICGYYQSGVLGDAAKVSFFAVLDKGNSAPTASSRLYTEYKKLAGTRRIAVGTTTVGNPGAVNSITPSGVYPPPQPVAAAQELSLGGFINLGADANGVPVRLRLVLADANVYYPGGPQNTYNVADTLGTAWGINLRTKRKNPNNWGLGWVLEYGAFRWYSAGDVGGYNGSYGTCVSCGSNYFDIETPMSKAFPLIYPQPVCAAGHICAQKVSHHGSCCSSNEVFLDTLKSSSAILSSGPSAGFGHPTQEVIDRLEAIRWNRDSIHHDSTYAYRITELYFNDRNINLAVGNTSGSALVVATDLPVNLAQVALTFLMANGSSLYQFQDPPVVPIIPGDVTIKVNPTNNGFPISARSYYTLEYAWYEGTVLTRTIYCHGQ